MSSCVDMTMCCSVIASSRLFPFLFSGKREYNALSSPLLSSSLYPLIACCSFIPPILPSGAKEERKKICCSFFTPLSHSPAPLWVTAATTISFESAHAPLPSTRPRSLARERYIAFSRGCVRSL